MNGGKVMRCAIYARLPTDKQDVQLIETQLMTCHQEISLRAWDDVACFPDEAESAATQHRRGMKALLAAAAAGGINIVYADAMGRLSGR